MDAIEKTCGQIVQLSRCSRSAGWRDEAKLRLVRSSLDINDVIECYQKRYPNADGKAGYDWLRIWAVDNKVGNVREKGPELINPL
jgi:hypothetical protein